MHETTVAGKALTAAYYGTLDYSYMTPVRRRHGAALHEVQKYPAITTARHRGHELI